MTSNTIITGVKREGSSELTTGSDGLTLSITESYHVMAESADMAQWEVMRDARALDDDVIDLLGYENGVQVDTLPFPGVTIHRDGICTCKNLGGEVDERNPRKWTFLARWSSRVEESRALSGGDPSADPETATVLRETLYEQVTRSRSKDLIGRAYVNGAGNLFNPAMQVDDELPRWDFSQFEPVYMGAVTGYFTTYASMTGAGSTYAVLTEADSVSTPGTIWPPGVYRRIAGAGWIFAAPTDATVFYFNGAVNATPFSGFPAYTLQLKVRSSRIGNYYGARRRISDYSIIYDKTNHWDKPLNAGPFFIAPVIDEDGNDTADTRSYPYIYYSADEETDATDLVVEEAGPLGFRNLTLTYNATTGKMEPPVPNDFDAKPTGAVTSIKKVKLPRGNSPVDQYVYRAVKPDPSQELFHIEYVNHELLDFNAYLRLA